MTGIPGQNGPLLAEHLLLCVRFYPNSLSFKSSGFEGVTNTDVTFTDGTPQKLLDILRLTNLG